MKWILPFLFCCRCLGATLNVTDFGAVGDCTTIQVDITDGSPQLFAHSGTPFTAGDVGKIVQIVGGDTVASPVTSWGGTPTNHQDRVAIIQSVLGNNLIQLDRVLGNSTNGTYMTYGTNNTLAFSNCLSVAVAGDTIHIGAGNYLLMNQSALDDGFTQSGQSDIGFPSMTLNNGGLTFKGDGTNSTILTGNGAWHVKGLQQAFRGTLIKFENIKGPTSEVRFDGIQFNGAASRNHSQLWTAIPAAPTDGSGWDVTHKAIYYAASPTTLSQLTITNCLFTQWHGETIQGADAGTGESDIGNCWFIDGNAPALLFNGPHTYRDNFCTDYYQFAQDGQAISVAGTSVIERNVVTNIDHGVLISLTGADKNFNGPAYLIRSNIFTGTNAYAITTAGAKNISISTNRFNGSMIGLGVSGNIGNFWNSNIVVYSNTFVGSTVAVYFRGSGPANFVQSVAISNNTATIAGTDYFAEALLAGNTFYTNVLLYGNTANKGVANLDTVGQWFYDDPSNAFPPKDTSDFVGVTNTLTYSYGARQRVQVALSQSKFILDDTHPLQVPTNAMMGITNLTALTIPVYLSASMNANPVNISPNSYTNVFWVPQVNIWSLSPFIFAASCSPADIQVAINSASVGATIVVPSGNCDFTAQVTNIPSKSVTLRSASFNTVLSNSIPSNGGASKEAMIHFSTLSNSPIFFRISGFKLVDGTAVPQNNDAGAIRVDGSGTAVRVDGNTFTINNQLQCGWYGPFGVYDHNTNIPTGFNAMIKIAHDSMYGLGNFGDYSWSIGPIYGGTNGLYIEDCVFTNASGSEGIGIDCQGGGNYVLRRCILDKVIAGGHGTETTGRERSSRSKEVYQNTFVGHGTSEAGHFRGGSGIVCSNIFANYAAAFHIRVYRMDSFVNIWGPVNATNAWDFNDNTVYGTGTVTSGGGGLMTAATGIPWTVNQWQHFTLADVNNQSAALVITNSANQVTYDINTIGNYMPFTPGDTYQYRKIIHVLDQPGRGMGDLMSNSPAMINGVTNWPNQVLEPIYMWNNTFSGVSSQLLNNQGYYPVVDGQEIVNGTPAPGWKPLPYPHYLITGSSVPIFLPLLIIVQPQSKTVYSTQSALFTITATGNNPLSYQWQTNGVNAGTNGPALSIGPCPVAWSGMTVVCSVSDVTGTNTSATASLTVLPDPVITAQPNNSTVGVGSTASFTVTASGQTPLSYLWSKNGVSIGGATQSSYTTPATVAGDNNSHFAVTVTDTAGSLLSATATLTVTNIISPPDPVITSQPQSTNIYATQIAKFGITATGGSAISLQWKTNGVNVSAGAGGTATPLTLGPCPVVWNGMSVVCIVSDLAGSVTSSTATLTVGADPVISVQPNNAVALTNTTATFTVTASGQTALSYQWSRNGTGISGATQSSYTTPPLNMSNNGESYFVDVTDSAGTLRSSTATLTVFINTNPRSKMSIHKLVANKAFSPPPP
jgi:hypothetical protein